MADHEHDMTDRGHQVPPPHAPPKAATLPRPHPHSHPQPYVHVKEGGGHPGVGHGMGAHVQQPFYSNVKQAVDPHLYDNCRGTVLRRASGSPSQTAAGTAHRKSMPAVLSSKDSPSKKIHEIQRPASAISEITAQKLESPKRVVIGDVITASRTSSPVSLTNEKPNGILKKDSSCLGAAERGHPTLERCVSIDAERSQQAGAGSGPAVTLTSTAEEKEVPPPPPEKKSHLTVDTTLAPGNNNSRHTSSSESPEWPSPPEPLTPQTPSTPLGQMEFDSDTIKRLLRSLPSSPVGNDDYDHGFHDDPSLEGQGQGRRNSSLARTKSLNTHDRQTTKGSAAVRGRVTHQHTVAGPVVCKAGELHFKSRMFNKVALEEELRKRNRCVAAAAVAAASQGSYPDSGIGMPGEVAGSLPSESSGKSGRPRDL
nr:hypothetical protein BaRGS_032115 [Batillaria attramentaria]